MKLRLVLSGGETGADLTGLEEAHKLGIPTGGFVWPDYWCERGKNLDLRDIYGLRTTRGNRTELNAAVGDCTIWFGFDPKATGGGQNTLYGCKRWGRPMFINPKPKTLIKIAEAFEVINIAGNRESINPTVVGKVQAAFAVWKQAFKLGDNDGLKSQGGEVRANQQGSYQGPGGAQSDWGLYRQG